MLVRLALGVVEVKGLDGEFRIKRGTRTGGMKLSALNSLRRSCPYIQFITYLLYDRPAAIRSSVLGIDVAQSIADVLPTGDEVP